MTDAFVEAEPAWSRLRTLGERIAAAVPPLDPPGCHWMSSDSGASYCWECARKVAWKEMGKEGDPPAETDWWRRTKAEAKVEEQIRDRIDGPSWGESDTSEACADCGRTLSYLLTDYGRGDELAHFAQNPISPEDTVDDELSYTLSRIFMNLDVPGADQKDAEAAVVIAEGAIAAVERELGAMKQEQRETSA